ncbi:short-chain fatty acyl-CoA regulator family protein [Sphingomonas canadensis]|uniref:Short-chain fatty acyl-CoA regulator family protein n=1 Tax=Sphingomonas canadensis TaxID=1219257 RepID=A0ABW3H997_9SPHN|nr:XRE family transcriptional regulator [Sphingomonas canadensis]MCW3837070.1 short-chain fatty acyl-CoA regulator family protein [Sphingomonas canadensis]
MSRRIFAGHLVRALRDRLGIAQADMAARIGISTSYLSQIENADRPITPAVLAALGEAFPGDWAAIDPEEDTSLLIDAVDAAGDPSVPEAALAPDTVRRGVEQQPQLARRMVALHRAFRRSQDQLAVLDDRYDAGSGEAARLPWEEVRDWFHAERNYVDAIDREAERIADALEGARGLEARLADRFGVRVETGGDRLRAYDPDARVLRLDPAQPPESQAFAVAHQLARLEFAGLIAETAHRGLDSAAGRELLSAGLANYAAGALLMPYARFRAAARELRHDIDRLRQRFGASFEQACHRLSTLQRPGAAGIPFFFCRVDMAGNITKRHSATRLQFARFGGACPLWVVHEAVAIPDRILVQLAETPDGVRYVSMAKGLVKPSGSYARAPRRFAVALGCEESHAREFIYADGLRIDGAATPIGSSCRICPRHDCDQRAFPPAGSEIRIDPDSRGTVPYAFR